MTMAFDGQRWPQWERYIGVRVREALVILDEASYCGLVRMVWLVLCFCRPWIQSHIQTMIGLLWYFMCRYIVCELVSVSDGKSCVLNLTESDIIHCLRTEVQRLHGDYGLAVVHLSLRGCTFCIFLFACRSHSSLFCSLCIPSHFHLWYIIFCS